jgi:hypothetical protein
MKDEKDLKDLANEKLAQLKTLFEEMEVQLSLGKSEAKDLYEREKKNFNAFVNEQKARFKKEEQIVEEKWNTLREKFEALEVQLAKDTPDGKEAFDEIKNATLRSIYELEKEIRDSYGDIGTNLKENLDQFKAKLDNYRIQLALSEFGDQAESDKRRAELQATLEEILARMRKEAEDANKLDDFAKEMSSSLEHMKKAFSDLFS